MCAGKLLLTSCLLLSGNSFTKTALLFKFLTLKFISKSLFYQHQGLYVAPAVQNCWDSMRQILLDERKKVKRSCSPQMLGMILQSIVYNIAHLQSQIWLMKSYCSRMFWMFVRYLGGKVPAWKLSVSGVAWMPY